MSYQPPGGWNEPPPTPQEPPAQQKKRSGPFKAGFLGCFGVLAAVVVAVIVISVIASSGSDTGRKTVSGTPGAAADQVATSEPSTAAADRATPKPSDFALRVKTLDKQCFGSAGCNVVYRVELAYHGPTLDPDTTYEVTYEVRGPEDGAQVGTLEVTGTKYTEPDEVVASTSSASTKLTAKVTEVAEQ